MESENATKNITMGQQSRIPNYDRVRHLLSLDLKSPRLNLGRIYN